MHVHAAEKMKRQAKTGERQDWWKQLLLGAMTVQTSPCSPSPVKRTLSASSVTPCSSPNRSPLGPASWIRVASVEETYESDSDLAWDRLNRPGGPLSAPSLTGTPTPKGPDAAAVVGGDNPTETQDMDASHYVFSFDVVKKKCVRTSKDGKRELCSAMNPGDKTIVAQWSDGTTHVTDLANVLIIVWKQQEDGTTPIIPKQKPKAKAKAKARSKSKRAADGEEDTLSEDEEAPISGFQVRTHGSKELAYLKMDAEIKTLLKNANSRGYHRVFSKTQNKKLAREAGRKLKRKLSRKLGLSCSASDDSGGE
jgi:hypothetical protein